ncbi:MAG TPA: hypothetical protein VGX03_10800, partial [Candidatus Binatia bacterium]|nr:hypothetical protein [Candidatus Binatia bacterium]
MTEAECDALCRGLHALQQKNMGEVVDVNAKAKGSRRERQARTILETAGYFVVKAGGSLGCWDLVALGPQGAR